MCLPSWCFSLFMFSRYVKVPFFQGIEEPACGLFSFHIWAKGSGKEDKWQSERIDVFGFEVGKV